MGYREERLISLRLYRGSRKGWHGAYPKTERLQRLCRVQMEIISNGLSEGAK